MEMMGGDSGADEYGVYVVVEPFDFPEPVDVDGDDGLISNRQQIGESLEIVLMEKLLVVVLRIIGT